MTGTPDHPIGVELWAFLNQAPQRDRLEGALQALKQQPVHNGELNKSGLAELLRARLFGVALAPDRNELSRMVSGKRPFAVSAAQCLLVAAGCDQSLVDYWSGRLGAPGPRPEQVTVPDLSEPALTASDLVAEFAELATDPLERLIDAPWLWLENMDYQVDVHLASADAEDPRSSVYVANTSRRVLGGSAAVDGGYWVSFARTEGAYQREFGRNAVGCLAREIVPLPDVDGSDWQEAIVQECSAHIVVDGSPVALVPEATEDEPDVVRWRTPADFAPPPARVLVEVEFHYPLDQARETFTVTFLSYYCLGNTRIKLTLHAPVATYELSTHVFYGRSLETPAPEPIHRVLPDRQVSTFTTGQRSLLWPGSGVYFGWRARGAR